MPPVVFLALATLVLTVNAPVATPAATTRSAEIESLIESLADPDPVVRTRAGERLLTLGSSVRPDLIRAARSGNPEQRARAAGLLESLPWHLATDPPAARALLERYGRLPDGGRIEILLQLRELEGGESVLLRLLSEEPSDTVRWAITACWIRPSVSRLYARERDTEDRMRALDTQTEDPQTLLLAGAAWLERDPARAVGYLRRAIDIEDARPTTDHGMLRYAFNELIAAAMKESRFDEAANLLRRQAPREAQLSAAAEDQDRDNIAVACLAGLHRHFGPLDGLASDLQTWGTPTAGTKAPVTLDDRVSELLASLGAPSPITRTDPFSLSAGEHYAAGVFFQRSELFPVAEIELTLALNSAVAQSIELVEAETCFALAQVAAELKDDARAAELLDQGLASLSRLGMETRRPPDDIRAEIHWRRARVAQSKRDLAGADESVRSLLQFTPSNTDLTISMILWLRETNRPDDAARLFERVYAQSRKDLDESDESDKPGQQNDLAWLCARTGQKLPEAVELARRAVEARPDNSAFVDTLADALYASGQRDQAIETEERALRLSPGNAFMVEQLARFRAGRP